MKKIQGPALRTFTVTLLILIPFATCKELRYRGNKECNGIANQMRLKGFAYPWWNATVGQQGDEAEGDVAGNSCPATGLGAVRSAKCCKSFDTPVSRNDTQHSFNSKWLGPKLALQAKVFNESKTKFDLTFKALLNRAHASFHAMFEKTYGLLYIQHADVFHELFNTFNSYYDAGRGSLEDKLNNFFAILTRKMFEVLNSQYEFDESYLSCAAIVISEKQGNELHKQIVSSLRRSFVATRALSQGLNDGFDVLTSLQKLEAPSDCILSLSQMLQCPICLEQRAYKPCIQLCTKVSTGCLSGTVVLNRPWTDFTSALEGVIDRLLGPYNVEAVVEPIHIKISEAIMNFQESGPDLSQAVFGKCGKPHLKSRSHNKREAAPIARGPGILKEDDDPKVGESRVRLGGGGRARGRNKGNQGASDRDDQESDQDNGDMQPSKSLEKFLKETKKKIQKTKTVWEKLPQQFCNGISKDFSSQLCWNGTSLIKPDKSNRTEEVSPTKPPIPTNRNVRGSNNQVVDQVMVLQVITSKLRDAYNGIEVTWVEDKSSLDDLEFGSGQGSGSGEAPSDLDDSDDDDPSGVIKPPARRPNYSPPPNFGQPPPNFGQPPPNFGQLPPSIFNPQPGPDLDEDEDDDDKDDNTISFGTGRIPGVIPSGGVDANSGLPTDFSHTPGKPVGKPNVPPVVIKPDFTPPTRNPSPTNDVTKKISTSSGNLDVTSRTVAVFKVFTPIFVSMLGKLVSLS